MTNFRFSTIKATLFGYWLPAATGFLVIFLLTHKRVALLKSVSYPLLGLFVLTLIGIGENALPHLFKVLIRKGLLQDVVTKLFWEFALPLGALLLLGAPLTEMGLQTISFGPGRYPCLGWSVTLSMTLPMLFHPRLRSFYFSRGTWTWRLPIAMFGAYVYSWLSAALPEEFFFRQLLQPRLIQMSDSMTLGILLTGILFAFTHTSHYKEVYRCSWYWALLQATIQEAPVGVLLGVIWIQTGGLSPVLFVHAWIDMVAFTPIAYKWLLSTVNNQTNS